MEKKETEIQKNCRRFLLAKVLCIDASETHWCERLYFLAILTERYR
jgi:hypothetical protein